MFKLRLIILTTLLIIVNGKLKYDNYKLYKVLPVTDKQFNGLKYLQSDSRFDFWTEIILNENVKVMVSPENQKYFEEYIHELDMEGSVVMKDVQQIIDEQTQKASSRTTRNTALGSLNWEGYNSLDQIYAWLEELEEMYPDVVTVVDIGITGEGRPIKGIKIDYQPEGRNETLIGMYEGGIHAREWISPATVTWIIKEFLTSSDPEVRGLARNFVWHIFPVVNPDGYEYTFTHDRMWRKNRNTNFATTCPNNDDMSNGIDLNRNFGFQWKGINNADYDNPCTNQFAGPRAFSELETLAISTYVHRIKAEGRLMYYIAFHSYSQLIVIPYSHLDLGDSDNIDNYADLYEIGIFAADAIQKRYDTRYRVGLSADVMYKMSGTSFDWVKSETNVPLCYLFELRDVGDYGFLLPQELIISNNLEIMDGLIEIDRKARELDYYSSANSSFLSLTLFVSSLLIMITRCL